MEYTSFYTNPQSFSLVHPPIGQPDEQIEQTYNSISPPPYASYDASYIQYNLNNAIPHGNTSSLMNHSVDLMSFDAEGDLIQASRTSSEEKDMTSQQHGPTIQRRKVQNRAAQRAFRERKEKHVKELEQRLSNLEASSSTVQVENDRLKQELHKISTENQILRATTINHHHHINSNKNSSTPDAKQEIDTGLSSYQPPMFSPKDFFNSLLEKHEDQTPNHRVVRSPTSGQRFLGAGAVWEMIITDPAVQDGMVDLSMVCQKLKGRAKCDGQGPVFEEDDVRNAILESSNAEDRDVLI